MDIQLTITLKDNDYGFSDLLGDRELDIKTKAEILDLIKEDLGFAFSNSIKVNKI